MTLPPGRRVLLVSAFAAPYIDEDAAIIGGNFSLRRVTGHGPAALLRALRGVLSADIVYAWFLSVYGAAAVLFGGVMGRRTVIVLGGVDVARNPEAGYGLWLSPWKAFLARRALRSADVVLAVSESLIEEAAGRAGYDGGNIRFLPTGYDPDFWTPHGPKNPRVLCVASVTGAARLAVKGIDVLVEAARRAGDIHVTIIGVDASLGSALAPPPNVVFLPPVPRSELLRHYRSAKVYCQPSRREGLPNALCEAMLCGCIPVISDAGGGPAAVGESGFIAAAGDAGALAAALRLAVSAPPARGEEARARISMLYPMERRRRELSAILETLSSPP